MRPLGAFALLQLGDVVTTWLSVRRHGVEVNPFVASLLHAGPVGWVYWLGAKVFIVFLLGVILLACYWQSGFENREVRLGRDIVLVGIGLAIAMVALNLTVVLS